MRQYVSFDSDGRDRGQPFDIPARLPVQHIRKLTGVEPKLLGRRHMARPAQNGKVFQCLVKGMGAKSSMWPQAKLSNLVMRYPAREASGIQADWHTEKLTYRAPPVFHPEHDKQVTHCMQSITKTLLPSEFDHLTNPVVHENGLGLFNRRKIDTSTKAVHRPLRSIGAVNEVIAYTNRLAVSSITPIMAPPINHFGRQQSCTDHEQYDKVLAYINEPRRQPFDPVDLTNEDVNGIVNEEDEDEENEEEDEEEDDDEEEEEDEFLDDLFEDSDDTELETTPAIERTQTVSDVKNTGFLQATESTDQSTKKESSSSDSDDDTFLDDLFEDETPSTNTSDEEKKKNVNNGRTAKGNENSESTDEDEEFLNNLLLSSSSSDDDEDVDLENMTEEELLAVIQAAEAAE